MSGSRTRSSFATMLALVALMSIAASPAPAATQFQDGTWSALDPAVPAPSARREYAAVYDVVNQRYIVIAGYDGGNFSYHLTNQVWTLSLPLFEPPTWTQLSIPGAKPGERHSPQWGYDPARNRVIMFGGYGRHYPGGPYEYLNDVWQLSLDGTPTWTELFPSGTPPTGRLAGAAVYDLLRQRFVGFGGTVGIPVDTWQLDLSGDPAWSTVETDSMGPRGGYSMTSIYDPVRDRMVIFGGSTSDEYYGVRDEVWELSLVGETPKWHQLHPAPGPSARRTMASIFDPLRDRMVIFGGWDAGYYVTSFLNDTWALSLSPLTDPQWDQLSPSGETPPARDAMTAVYDPIGDRLVMFGGWSGVTMLGDTQFLSWGGIGESATVNASSESAPGLARVHWTVQNATGSHAAVYRRQLGTPWSSLATVESSPTGAVTYEDHAVTPGGHYGYLITVPSERGQEFAGEVWVDVPTAAGVMPTGNAAFALHGVRPNPAVDRFSVSFALPSAEPARLELLDLTGRRVLSREVGAFGKGQHQIEIDDARTLAPGMYFLRLAQANRSTTSRVVIRSAGN